MSRPPLQAFRDALSAQALRQLQVVHLAIPAGALLFAGVTLLLAPLADPPAAELASKAELVRTLSLVHALMFLSLLPLALLLPRASVARGVQGLREQELPAPLAAQRALHLVRTASILRLALLEGAALFGVVVCLLAALDGLSSRQPLVWLNLGSTAVLLVASALCFPTRERLEALYREHAQL